MNNERLILKALERLITYNVYCDCGEDILNEIREVLYPKEQPSLPSKTKNALRGDSE